MSSAADWTTVCLLAAPPVHSSAVVGSGRLHWMRFYLSIGRSFPRLLVTTCESAKEVVFSLACVR